VLGDIHDGGKKIADGDPEWPEMMRRWAWVFSNVASTRNFTTILICGNHDVGFASAVVANRSARFERVFGPLHFVVHPKGFEIVGLCTPGMSTGEGRHWDEAVALLEALGPPKDTRIVLTHVPLYRPRGTSCGSNLEMIMHRRGPDYANMLGATDSAMILDLASPAAVFSGDHHRECTVRHRKSTIEYTIPTLSIVGGTSRTAYALATLAPGGFVAVALCVLPNGYLTYGLLYPAFGVVSIATIIVRSRSRVYEISVGFATFAIAWLATLVWESIA
jgi:hypothetical protein